MNIGYFSSEMYFDADVRMKLLVLFSFFAGVCNFGFLEKDMLYWYYYYFLRMYYSIWGLFLKENWAFFKNLMVVSSEILVISGFYGAGSLSARL